MNVPPYSVLAPAYDKILEHVNYDVWYDYILALMKRYVEKPEVIVELGCGTGRFGVKFSADGYTIYGIDRSLDMLKAAKSRAKKNFRLICADMTSFALAKPADFIFCVHDTVNYLLSKTELCNFFSCVRNAMHEKSVFMFDMTTSYNIENYFDNLSYVYEIKGKKVEWDNSFNRRKGFVHSILRFHNGDGTYHEENHYQRLYSIPVVKRLLEQEKFEVLGIFGDSTFNDPGSKTIMVNFVAKRKV